MDSHVFNEQKKCLDPIDNRCMCCDAGFSRGEDDNFYIPIFKENDRTNLLVYRNVKYSRINVGVARCKNCKEAHKQAKVMSVLLSLGIGLGGAVLSVAVGFALAFWTDWTVIFSILVVIGIVASVIFSASKGSDYEEKLLNKKNVLSKQTAAQQYGIVRSLLNDGWSFIQPSA